MQQTRYQDAAGTLQSLSSRNCDARVSLLLAAALEAGGNVPAAAEVLRQAHSVWPLNNSIAASLARQYLAAGQTDKASKALAHFHAVAATPEQEMEMAAVVFLAAHQLVAAQAVAQTAYKFHPSLRILLLLSNTWQMQGRYLDVNRLLGGKREIYADSSAFFITLAESEYDTGLYSVARKDIEQALLLDHASYQAHYILGNVLSKLNEADRAIAEYRTAIDLAPDQPRTYYQLALVLRSKQDETGEEHVLEQALAADGHYAPANCEMGRILVEQHRFAEAVSHLNLTIQYSPNSEEAYYLLAKVYARLGEKDKSNEMVKRLVAVQKANRLMVGKHPGQPKEDQAENR